MAALKLEHDHNKVAYLGMKRGHEFYEPMVEFLKRSKIHYALTHSPSVIYESLVRQFWQTAKKRSATEIVAKIDGVECVVTEAFIRTQLRLNDEGGVYHQRSREILVGLREVGYQSTETDMWHKNLFCPMWRFLVHTLL